MERVRRVAPREEALARAWETGRYRPRSLLDDAGHTWRVIFPGRRWGGPGPDFQGAVLLDQRGEVVRGDVEVHGSSRAWRDHKHASNSAYERVVLHVVGRYDGPVYDGRGCRIPTAIVEPGGPSIAVPRSACQQPGSQISVDVEAAGWEWFRGRVARFSGDLSVHNPSQVAWHALAEALGYSRNTRPMGLLADVIPWNEAQRQVAKGGAPALASLLLGTAGLTAGMNAQEARVWAELARAGEARSLLRPGSWERAAVRPGNAPQQRCRGLAAVAAQCAGAELSDVLLAAVKRADGRDGTQRLLALTRVEPWVGRGRAHTVAVNVLVPLAAALGEPTAEDVFARLPGEPWNRPTRYMAELLGLHLRQARLAIHRQGLLQLYKQACATHWCDVCPSGQRVSAARA